MFYISFDKCLKVKVHKLSGRQTNVYIPTLIHHQHLYPIGYLGMFLFRHCKHIVKSSYPKGKKIHKKWRCLSINLQPEYVPRCFKNQMQKKNYIKKKKIRAFKHTHSEWKKGKWFIITCQSRWRKMLHSLFWCQIMYQI